MSKGVLGEDTVETDDIHELIDNDPPAGAMKPGHAACDKQNHPTDLGERDG